MGGVPQAAAGGLLGTVLVLRGGIDEAYPLLAECLTAMNETNSLWLEVQLIHVVVGFIWLEEYDRARHTLERAIGRARAASAPGALPYALCYLSDLDFRIGRWSTSHAHAAEAAQLGRELGHPITLAYALLRLGWVEARLGRERECREHAAAACDLFEAPGTTITTYRDAILGSLELGLGHWGEAVDRLELLSRFCDQEGIVEPNVFQHTPDLIESYVHAGLRVDAEAALATFEAIADKTQRTWALATAARCHGILAAEDFERYFEEALRWHSRTPTPFDRARTELCYGERLRRVRRRAEARERLHSALETFERLGAEPWAIRARAELLATGETAKRRDWPGSQQLTLQELQVALKVAVGATNREVAAALFLSPKTIEAHLGRIYGKLGLRSRTELAHHLAHERGGSLAELGT
jgi:DNA-binding CsgD family transcriptional regulator